MDTLFYVSFLSVSYGYIVSEAVREYFRRTR